MELDVKQITDHFDRYHGEMKGKYEEVAARLMEVEQKMARQTGYGAAALDESWGQQVVKSPELKAFSDNNTRPSRLRLDMKSTITSAADSAGALGVPHRDQAVMMPRKRFAVRDLLPVIKITSGSVEYPKQTERTINAEPVAEGNLKPESEMAFELKNTPVRTIAHWVPASRQILEDAPQLAGLIDTELRYGLELKEDAQLLNGDGTGQNLHGLVPQATAYAPPIEIEDPNMIDKIGLAILQNAVADLPADGIVMNAADWMRIRLLKDQDGNYILGAPGAAVEPRLFGLPVVATTGIALDKFLVGSFQAAATLYDRWEARVEVSTEHADFFTRNLVAVLAEERVALAVKQAAALTYGSFGNDN